MTTRIRLLGLILLVSLLGCNAMRSRARSVELPEPIVQQAKKISPNASPLERLNASAIEQTTLTTTYDPAYVKLDYPNGDVPIETGVCSDVVVRAFRKAGIDLQKELHEDMTAHFAKYPKKWGAKRPDKNIDHRRVPNLMTWFDRKGKSLPITRNGGDYQPGDVVSWDLADGRPHIGVVSTIKVEGTDRYAIIHNIGLGARAEDVLFEWTIKGHYRYF